MEDGRRTMRSVRLVGALGIAFAFLFTTLAGGHDGPAVAAPSAPGQIALLDTYVVNPAGFLADGGTVLHDYGNGYLLVRLAPGMRAMSASVRGVDWMPDRTIVDLWFSGVRLDTSGIEPALPDTLHVQTGDAYLLQFVGPIDRSWVVVLEQSGVHFEQYLANFAFVVIGSADAIRAAKASPFVGWVGPYYAGYKVGTALLQRQGTVALSVIGFPDADPLTLAGEIANLGGNVASVSFQPA